jgi:hypothetical protein
VDSTGELGIGSGGVLMSPELIQIHLLLSFGELAGGFPFTTHTALEPAKYQPEKTLAS